jgi:predicted dehydrogenase
MSSKNEPVRLGVIGCGRRMRVLGEHLMAVRAPFQVSGLYDPAPEAIEAYRQEVSADASGYGSVEELLADPQLEWVMVGSPNHLHREHVVAAFEQGKHVFSEKPVATTLEDHLAIRDAWRRSGCRFMLGFTLRYSPHYRRIKKLVDEGRIGRIMSLEFNETLSFNHGGYIMGGWRRFRDRAGPHVLEKCSHDVDIVNWLVQDRVTEVASFGGRDFFVPDNAGAIGRLGRDHEGRDAYRTWQGPGDENPFTSEKDIVDNQVAILQFRGGARATFHTNLTAGIPERRMSIVGTEGTIRSDVLSGSIEVAQVGFSQSPQDESTGYGGIHGGGDPFLCEHLAQSMTTDNVPTTGLEAGIDAAVVCFGIDQALQSGTVADLTPLWEQVDSRT